LAVERFYGAILMRFDLSGQPVDEFSSEDNFWFAAVEPDPRGGAMIFQRPDRLLRVAGGGPEEVELSRDGEYLWAIVAELEAAVPAAEIAGDRYPTPLMAMLDSEKDA
jgi:hypothetical protein